VPLFTGSRDLVEKAEQFIREHDQAWMKSYMPHRQGKTAV
jgi:hypothetical protein